MVLHNPYQIQAAYAQVQQHQDGGEFWATRAALNLYQQVRRRSALRRIWTALTRQRGRLLDLDMIRAACTIRCRYHAGLRTVKICQIHGSEGRCQDFDADFFPVRQHSAGRWVSLAVARRMGAALPPVTLIQVGDVYFVRDGHHRISVAAALDQKEIDADVTVWKVVGPLPWEQASTARRTVHQPA